MNYRPKNCMKCGGKKMQIGGMAAAKAHPLTRDAVNQHIFDVTGQLPDKQNHMTAMDAGLGMNALSDILAEISGRVDRGRQDQYMMNQFSALGQMNPMPVNDFQPNPYSLYAKYGGSLRRYQMGGAHPIDTMVGGTGVPNMAEAQRMYDTETMRARRANEKMNDPKRMVNIYNYLVQHANEPMNKVMVNGRDTRVGSTLSPSDTIPSIVGRANMGIDDVYAHPEAAKNGRVPVTIPVNEKNLLGKPDYFFSDFKNNISEDAYKKLSPFPYYGGTKRFAYGGLQHANYFGPAFSNHAEMDMTGRAEFQGGGLSRAKDYGSSSHPYPSVASGDFAGPHRSYPIPTRADAIDALRLAHLHGRSDVIAKVHEKYPGLKHGGWIKSAVNPSHKGYCTPMSKPTCTGHRRAFALMMKKKHGFHKH